MVDILVITAHPDDELTVSGVLLKAKREGLRTALICLTKGESGGFATKEERVSEFNGATNALGLDAAWILDFPDAGLEVDTAAVETLIPLLRECEARTILTIHKDDYHPDHRAVNALVDRAVFVAGLKKYSGDGRTWHPSQVLTFSLDSRRNRKTADIIVDISDVEEQWRRVIASYPSQAVEEMMHQQAAHLGAIGGFRLAEGLYLAEPLKVERVECLLNRSKRGR